MRPGQPLAERLHDAGSSTSGPGGDVPVDKHLQSVQHGSACFGSDPRKETSSTSRCRSVVSSARLWRVASSSGEGPCSAKRRASPRRALGRPLNPFPSSRGALEQLVPLEQAPAPLLLFAGPAGAPRGPGDSAAGDRAGAPANPGTKALTSRGRLTDSGRERSSGQFPSLRSARLDEVMADIPIGKPYR